MSTPFTPALFKAVQQSYGYLVQSHLEESQKWLPPRFTPFTVCKPITKDQIDVAEKEIMLHALIKSVAEIINILWWLTNTFDVKDAVLEPACPKDVLVQIDLDTQIEWLTIRFKEGATMLSQYIPELHRKKLTMKLLSYIGDPNSGSGRTFTSGLTECIDMIKVKIVKFYRNNKFDSWTLYKDETDQFMLEAIKYFQGQNIDWFELGDPRLYQMRAVADKAEVLRKQAKAKQVKSQNPVTVPTYDVDVKE